MRPNDGRSSDTQKTAPPHRHRDCNASPSQCSCFVACVSPAFLRIPGLEQRRLHLSESCLHAPRRLRCVKTRFTAAREAMLGGNLDRRSHHNAETPFRLGVDRQQAIALACAAMEIVCHALMRRWLLCVRAQSVFSTLLCPRQANHEHNARDARSSPSDELALRHIKRLVAFFPIRLIVPGISPACGSRFPWPISSRVVNLSAAPRSAGLSRASRTAACPPASEASCRLNGRIFPPCAREARARRVSSAPDLPFYFDPFLRWARQDSLLITPPLLWSSLLHCLTAFAPSASLLLTSPCFFPSAGPHRHAMSLFRRASTLHLLLPFTRTRSSLTLALTDADKKLFAGSAADNDSESAFPYPDGDRESAGPKDEAGGGDEEYRMYKRRWIGVVAIVRVSFPPSAPRARG